MMVAARRHNVDDGTLSRNGGTDEKDGAGAPTADALQAIVVGNRYKNLSLYPSSFDANGHYSAVDVFVGTGQRIRAVLGWMFCVENGSSTLKTDLDLQLVDKAYGNVVDSSSSYSNSLEMLEFKNTGSGRTYTLRIRLWGSMNACNGWAHEYAGVVWAVHSDY